MRYLAAIILLVIMLTGCRRYSEGFDAYFCTSTGAGKAYLYIDRKKIGPLPYTAHVPRVETVYRYGDNNLLYISLPAGRHLVQVMDADGNLLFSERMHAGRSGRSSRISTWPGSSGWGSRIKVKDDCMLADLRY